MPSPAWACFQAPEKSAHGQTSLAMPRPHLWITATETYYGFHLYCANLPCVAFVGIALIGRLLSSRRVRASK